LPLTGIEPPFKLSVLLGSSQLTVPLHCATLGVLAMVRPLGKVSVNATPVNVTALPTGFVRVNVKTEVTPAAMEVGEKALLMVGGAITLNVSQASVWLVAS
jgi:hypothetical protein